MTKEFVPWASDVQFVVLTFGRQLGRNGATLRFIKMLEGNDV